jgi:hypothetical protein
MKARINLKSQLKALSQPSFAVDARIQGQNPN